MTASTPTNDFKNLWTPQQVHDGAAQYAAFMMLEKLYLLENFPEAAEQISKHSAQSKAAYLKTKNIVKPRDLAEHLARFEANLFESQVSVTGDDNKATLHKLHPSAWLKAKEIAKMSRSQEEKMAAYQESFFQELASILGLNAEVKVAPDFKSEEITFSQK